MMFVTDMEKGAWIVDAPDITPLAGMILWRYRNRFQETFHEERIFLQLDVDLFPDDGRFCEIFQLWIHPKVRRRGIGSDLKRRAESESLRHGVTMIYTHTEEINHGVLALNEKLGYREVRRGPIWDDVVRVSLVKVIEGLDQTM